MDLEYAKGPATDAINAFKQQVPGDESGAFPPGYVR